MRIVAEIGAAHNGSLQRALAIVEAAGAAGATAVKLQTWGENMAAPYVIPSGPWAGRNLQELYAECRTPWEWHGPIFAHCKSLGFECFSTPFDKESVDFLETLDCPRYKIASCELVDLDLIEYAGHTLKPMALSTGMATQKEITEALAVAGPNVTLLKCVSSYPAAAEDYNLRTMKRMAEDFGCFVGISDHSKGTAAAVVATVMGATMIERHLSLDNEGPDGGFASNPSEFKAMVDAVRQAEKIVGEVRYGPLPSEIDTLALRRSLYVVKDIEPGEALDSENMGTRRPALGMAPNRLPWLIGRKLPRGATAGTPITPDLLDA